MIFVIIRAIAIIIHHLQAFQVIEILFQVRVFQIQAFIQHFKTIPDPYINSFYLIINYLPLHNRNNVHTIIPQTQNQASLIMVLAQLMAFQIIIIRKKRIDSQKYRRHIVALKQLFEQIYSAILRVRQWFSYY